MKKRLFYIFVFALLLRTVSLGSLPSGFHADEVRVGWNAYSILKTGLDDRGNFLAAHYNTFGDWRPTGIFYVTVPSIAIFGLNEFAVRLPVALFGALTVIPVYFLAVELLKNKNLGLLSAALLAISPWHISVSRATSEVVVAMFFALFGIYLFIKAVNHETNKYLRQSVVLMLTSYLFYHSIRLLAPMFVIIIIWHFKSKINIKIIKAMAILVLATIIFSLSSSATGRFAQVSIFGDLETKKVLAATDTFNIKTPFDYKYVTYTTSFVQEYSKYFNAEFLVGTDTLPIRYRSPGFGLITYAGLALLIIGVITSLQNKKYKLLFLLLLIAPLPAALTTEDAPNLHRSLFMLPFLIMFMALGLEKIKSKKVILIPLVLLFTVNWIYFGVSYTTRAQDVTAAKRNYGAKILALQLNELGSSYEKVIVTNDPDDPYPWYAFYNNLSPSEFNKAAIKRSEGSWEYKNILFTQSECPSGDIFPSRIEPFLEENILVVDGFKCPIESKIKDGMKAEILQQIFNPNGSIAYTLWIPANDEKN